MRIFDLVDVPIVGINMAKLSYQYVFSKGIDQLKEDLDSFLPDGIYFDHTENLSLSEKEIGEAILELYFIQILRPGKLFLDFRPNCFQEINTQLKWEPNGLHCEMNESFKKGLGDVYKGFYLEDRNLYLSGLYKIGLITDSDSEEAKEEMIDIFNDHFGDVLWMNGKKIQARYYWNYVLGLEDTEQDLKNKVKEKLIKGL